MKVVTGILAALLASSALAQGRVSSTGPFTGYEADMLSEIWPEIRQAADFNDINWRAHGLDRAPGTAEARRVLAENWSQVRQEQRFTSIDWDQITDRGWSDNRRNRSASDDRFQRFPANEVDYSETGPFTREEAAMMSRLWGSIREAASYDDIDWRALGAREPGDREAQRIMASNWGQFREAARFEDIDWDSTVARSRTRVYR